MKGYMVPRKAGWDTQWTSGRAEVEKLLGLDGKEQIEEYGVGAVHPEVQRGVWKYKGMWEDFSSPLVSKADMEHPLCYLRQ